MEDSDTEESNFDEKDLCDDYELDDTSDGASESDICIICEDFGKKTETWFRCTSCGRWVHKDCSGAESPKDYVCDFCSSLSLNKFLKEWKQEKVILIKKPTKEFARRKEYRSILDTVAKVYIEIEILNNEELRKYQYDFRKGASTVDSMYTIKEWEIKKLEKEIDDSYNF
ncbi:hypothetical protein FQR65_LT05970 [Abscondita terminalis]|nr:hypothetical protein FQR65_LT05970 [Abscondita terminalis]